MHATSSMLIPLLLPVLPLIQVKTCFAYPVYETLNLNIERYLTHIHPPFAPGLSTRSISCASGVLGCMGCCVWRHMNQEREMSSCLNLDMSKKSFLGTPRSKKSGMQHQTPNNIVSLIQHLKRFPHLLDHDVPPSSFLPPIWVPDAKIDAFMGTLQQAPSAWLLQVTRTVSPSFLLFTRIPGGELVLSRPYPIMDLLCLEPSCILPFIWSHMHVQDAPSGMEGADSQSVLQAAEAGLMFLMRATKWEVLCNFQAICKDANKASVTDVKVY
ncbi:hypothetical protein BDR05DRAFT_953608 [Suillus weaverae]|nr:hypothetical protein BDR05DRAFT_953608 [Suillus weaverae]